MRTKMLLRRISPVIMQRYSRVMEQHLRRRFTKSFAKLAEDLATLLEGGVPIREAVAYLRQQQPVSREVRTLLETAETGITAGTGLGEVWSRWLTPVAAAVLVVGAGAGQLTLVLKTWAADFRRQREWTSQIIKVCIYPVLLFAGNLGAQLIVAWVLIPEFQMMYQSAGITLSRTSQSFLEGVQLLPNVLLTILVTLLLSVVLLSRQAQRQSEMWKRVERFVPGHQVITALRTQRLCFFLKMLLEGGTAIIEALDILRQHGGSKWMRELCQEARTQLLRGERLSKSFAQGLDPLLPSMLALSEQTGDLVGALNQTELFLQKFVMRRMEGILKWIEPVMLLLLGSVIAVTMYVLFVPMYEMISSVSSATP